MRRAAIVFGLLLVGCKMMRLDAALLAEHYAHHVEKPFYPRIAEPGEDVAERIELAVERSQSIIHGEARDIVEDVWRLLDQSPEIAR